MTHVKNFGDFLNESESNGANVLLISGFQPGDILDYGIFSTKATDKKTALEDAKRHMMEEMDEDSDVEIYLFIPAKGELIDVN
jgi:hypothetical protein